MVFEERAEQMRGSLVKTLQASGITSPRVLDAFGTVPRHLLVRTYYEQQEGQWKEVSEESETVYANQALVTQISDGKPTSSSSQPSLMAAMLEALDLQPGQHILEIGTGSGYNVALLASLVGDPTLITTLDINSALVEQARYTLEQAGYQGFYFHVGDGLEGYPPGAPYDRIIATASTSQVPLSWLDQLAPGGILVMPLQNQLAGALLQLHKHADGTASGTFLNVANVAFMPLRPFPVLDLTEFLASPVVAIFPCDDLSCSLFETFLWRFWLHLAFPHARILRIERDRQMCPVLLDGATQSMLMCVPQRHGCLLEIRGNQELGGRFQHSYAQWNHAGQPTLLDYAFVFTLDGEQWVSVANQQFRWRLDE